MQTGFFNLALDTIVGEGNFEVKSALLRKTLPYVTFCFQLRFWINTYNCIQIICIQVYLQMIIKQKLQETVLAQPAGAVENADFIFNKCLV